VKWRGYPDPTWEPEDFLTEVQAVDAFHTRYPMKPKPLELTSTVSASQELNNERGSYSHDMDPLRDTPMIIRVGGRCVLGFEDSVWGIRVSA
jgi:hypothetical protein